MMIKWGKRSYGLKNAFYWLLLEFLACWLTLCNPRRLHLPPMPSYMLCVWNGGSSRYICTSEKGVKWCCSSKNEMRMMIWIREKEKKICFIQQLCSDKHSVSSKYILLSLSRPLLFSFFSEWILMMTCRKWSWWFSSLMCLLAPHTPFSFRKDYELHTIFFQIAITIFFLSAKKML